MTRRSAIGVLTGVLVVGACAAEHEPRGSSTVEQPIPVGETLEIVAVPRQTYLRIAGIAKPLQEATLSTKLFGAVTAVLVHEGDVVRAGQTLLRIDARDLTAKAAQLDAALAQAQAAHDEAALHATRMRALFADEAAPQAQLDAAEAGLARAVAAVEAVRASAAELAATHVYATVIAPFSGIVTRRLVDPGSFAAPAAPLLVIQDVSALRVSASAAPAEARRVRRGQEIPAVIEGQTVSARIEGVVPSAGNLYTVNAIVANPDGRLAAGGVATLALPLELRNTIVVPQRAVLHQGELTGVHMQRGNDVFIRWVRLGAADADSVEISSGLQPDDRIIVRPAGSE